MNNINISFSFIIIILMLSCKSDRNKHIIEYDVFNSFSSNEESYDLNELKTEKLLVKKNDENQLLELIVYSDKQIKNFTSEDFFLIHEEGIYIVISNSDIKVYNTKNNKNSTYKFKLLKHYFEVTNIFDEEIVSIYLSDSCTSTRVDIDGKEQSKTIKFNQIFEDNIFQLITETPSYVYIYKLNLKEKPVFFTEKEPIFSLLKSNWNSFSDTPVEKVYLDTKNEFIERKETQYTNHKHKFEGYIFKWEANNNSQSYTISKFALLEKIKEEYE